jgi:hypothetical protein
MRPVGQQGGDQDIGHAGQEIGLGQYLVMVGNAIEKGGLADEEQEGQDGITYGGIMESAIQCVQDEPVEIVVLGMQRRRDGVQEEGKLQYEGIYNKDQPIQRGFLSEDAYHLTISFRNQLLQSKDNFCKDKE